MNERRQIAATTGDGKANKSVYITISTFHQILHLKLASSAMHP